MFLSLCTITLGTARPVHNIHILLTLLEFLPKHLLVKARSDVPPLGRLSRSLPSYAKLSDMFIIMYFGLPFFGS
jgi:hypothetical protein